ncbi:hypothetical protein [Dyadobacter sp. 3J3]|uniref:hypothetical protein n=1 Tax=Dyadobacter sp. 3J3 TaxID=2606600 RepID=UPI00135B3B40|nr:hypothetical protein [Dyadobacter sp. 3J3]
MTNIVTREFIPGKTTHFPPRSKCRRRGRHCNAGIHSRGKQPLSRQDPNAVGTADIVAGFHSRGKQPIPRQI